MGLDLFLFSYVILMILMNIFTPLNTKQFKYG